MAHPLTDCESMIAMILILIKKISVESTKHSGWDVLVNISVEH